MVISTEWKAVSTLTLSVAEESYMFTHAVDALPEDRYPLYALCCQFFSVWTNNPVLFVPPLTHL